MFRIKHEWLDRVLLVPRMRKAMRVRTFNRAYATLYAVGCSPEELRKVEMIGTSQVIRLGRGMQHYLEESGRIPHIRVFCFGSSADLQKTPSGIRQWVSKPFGGGIWVREMRAAIALFDGDSPIRRIIIHELTHALLDVLTQGFPYPIAIAERFARRTEYLLPHRNGESEWANASCTPVTTGKRYWDSTDLMSIREL